MLLKAFALVFEIFGENGKGFFNYGPILCSLKMIVYINALVYNGKNLTVIRNVL